jgi:hypothetical protein
MISSVSSTPPPAQVQQSQQYQQNVQSQKTKEKEDPQDTVILSKQASGTSDVDTGGNSEP